MSAGTKRTMSITRIIGPHKTCGGTLRNAALIPLEQSRVYYKTGGKLYFSYPVRQKDGSYKFMDLRELRAGDPGHVYCAAKDTEVEQSMREMPASAVLPVWLGFSNAAFDARFVPVRNLLKWGWDRRQHPVVRSAMQQVCVNCAGEGGGAFDDGGLEGLESLVDNTANDPAYLAPLASLVLVKNDDGVLIRAEVLETLPKGVVPQAWIATHAGVVTDVARQQGAVVAQFRVPRRAPQLAETPAVI